ncbi:integumentary mucin B.1-like [Hyla sarda]|uniref:integumentary mucin B.1-like n=1 Tax=Hyla sarda TaxID=327740 RepID=UPI0024C2FD5C|nr:integumentary mucin B.1-like [Hyla sarda]
MGEGHWAGVKMGCGGFYYPEIPEGYIPGIPEDYIPGIPEVYYPEIPEGYIPGIPEVYYPEIPEGYIPGIPEVYYPEIPEGYIPGIPEVYYPEIPEGYIPGIPEVYYPEIPEGYIPGIPEGYQVIVPDAGPVFPHLPTFDFQKYLTQTVHDCCGPSGEILNDGDTWEFGCNVCTCNGITGIMDCEPRDCDQEVVCGENERKVFTDLTKQSKDSCCGHCEPLTCKHNGTDYKINETFIDPENPCVVYTCEVTGLSVWVDTCPKQKYCTKDRRTYDENGCCYTCDNSCKPSPTTIELTITYTDFDDNYEGSCSSFVTMAKCSGECEEAKSRYDTDMHKVVSDCYCCKDVASEERTIDMMCEDGSIRPYTYSHITACSCNACTDTFTYR